MNRHNCMSAALVCMIFLGGCEETKYVIEMKTEGKVLHRTITWPNSNETELDRLAKLYTVRSGRLRANKWVFKGEFVGKTPNDVGGPGSYTHLITDMGTVSAYAERFHGSDDLMGKVRRTQQACDRVIDLVIGWLQTELGNNSSFDKLRTFCDQQLREDIKNLALHVWLGQAIAELDDERAEQEMFVRICQYLIEREYFNPEDLPSLVGAIRYGDARQDYSRLLFVIRSFVAEKMEIEEQPAEHGPLAFLTTAKRVRESFEAYLVQTDEYKKYVKNLPKQEKGEKNADISDPIGTFFAELIYVASGFDVSFSSGRLKLKLACESEPFMTNGKWNSKTRRVDWSRSVRSGTCPPTLCYAFWSSPKAEFQIDHFDRVVLKGRDLGRYCLWRAGLNEKDAREWDVFVLELKPGKNLVKRLESFRFSSELAEGKHDLANMPRRLILNALKESSAESTE